jgi:hypothetical protein
MLRQMHNALGNRLPMVECASVSEASDSKRPATGSGLFTSEPRAWIAAILDSNPLLCRPRVAATQHAATNTVARTEETFRSILPLLSQVSSTAPFHSSVSSHDEMAKRQEAGRLDKGGKHVWISFSGSVANMLRRDLKAVELSITTP